MLGMPASPLWDRLSIDSSAATPPTPQTDVTWRYKDVDYTCNDFQTVCAAYFGPGNTGACVAYDMQRAMRWSFAFLACHSHPP